MKYGEIKKTDIANGPGVRVSLFVSGCTHHCKGCFNPETWDFEYGNVFTEDTQEQIFELLAPDYIAGLTVLGGQPACAAAVSKGGKETVSAEKYLVLHRIPAGRGVMERQCGEM